MGRTTRGDTAKAKAASSEDLEEEEEAPKAVPAKGKKTVAKKKAAAPNKKTKAKKGETSEDSAPPAEDGTTTSTPTKTTGISVTIEACKQCGVLTRAKKIVKALEGKAEVVINPEPPTKGSFVVRINGGDPVFELVGLKRAAPQLKDLDMDDVIQTVLQAVAAVGEGTTAATTTTPATAET